MGLEQIELLQNEGLSPESIIVGHCDRRLDWDYLLPLAQTGAYMIFDQISKEKYYPDALRIDYIKRLIEAGYGQQILLSCDLARRSYFPAYGTGGGPGMTYLLWRFVPWMRQEGVAESVIADLLIHNPARALSIANP
jgi:phosphotriesterase-related protein